MTRVIGNKRLRVAQLSGHRYVVIDDSELAERRKTLSPIFTSMSAAERWAYRRRDLEGSYKRHKHFMKRYPIYRVSSLAQEAERDFKDIGRQIMQARAVREVLNERFPDDGPDIFDLPSDAGSHQIQIQNIEWSTGDPPLPRVSPLQISTSEGELLELLYKWHEIALNISPENAAWPESVDLDRATREALKNYGRL